jgi:hypothetical protein
VGGRIILKWIFRELGWGGMDWIDLAQNRDQWRALVNTVIILLGNWRLLKKGSAPWSSPIASFQR